MDYQIHRPSSLNYDQFYLNGWRENNQIACKVFNWQRDIQDWIENRYPKEEPQEGLLILSFSYVGVTILWR